LCQFLREDRTKTDRYVLFFTDMFEECTLEGAGQMTLNKTCKPSEVERMVKAIEDRYVPDCPIGSTPEVHLAMVISTANISSGTSGLNREQLEKVWEAILAKHGFSGSEQLIYFDDEAVVDMINH